MRKGFTLIELIVVMAILAILVTLAAPKFLGQTEKAKQTALKVDVKVLEDAAMMSAMASDDGNTLPTTGSAIAFADDATMDFENEAAFTAQVAGGVAYALDEDKVDDHYKNLNGDISNYAIIVGGEANGSVFALNSVAGVRDIAK